HLVDGLGEPDAPLLAGSRLLELALAASARMDLRLDHPDRPGKLLSRGDRLLDCESRKPLRRRHAILPEQLFGLVLVDVHWRGFLLNAVDGTASVFSHLSLPPPVIPAEAGIQITRP